MFRRHNWWLILIVAYLGIHIGVSTTYSPIPDNPEMFGWLNVYQRFVPAAILILLVPQVQRFLNPLANVKIWTILGFAGVIACLTIYFTNIPSRWFAWTSLGLITLLMVYIANKHKTLGNVNSWMLGGMTVLGAMGVWECLYQVGLWFYYDFFGCGNMSFFVTLVMQFTWIIPGVITALVMYQRGMRLRFNLLSIVCIGVSLVATIIWFATGMDIPLMFWEGHFLEVNEAARPLLISISRASQSFWLVGIALLVGARKERKEVT